MKQVFGDRRPWKAIVHFRKQVLKYALIIQSNFKRTSFEPKFLYHLQDDPQEDSNLVNKPKVKDAVARMYYKECLEIVASGRPTVPNR